MKGDDKMKHKTARVLALALALSSLFSLAAYAASPNPDSIQSSYYIDSYTAYVYSPGDYEAQVWFHIMACRESDEVGALTIFLQQSDDCVNTTPVKTFHHYDYPNMIKENTVINISHVSETVEHGHYYRACLTLYVANNGGSDSRFYVTDWVYI